MGSTAVPSPQILPVIFILLGAKTVGQIPTSGTRVLRLSEPYTHSTCSLCVLAGVSSLVSTRTLPFLLLSVNNCGSCVIVTVAFW